MNLLQIDPKDKRQVQEFLKLPFRIYGNTPQWVPPIQSDERLRLDTNRYPYYKHSKAAFFLVKENKRTTGRLAVLDPCLYNLYNHEQTAFFTLFECEDNLKAAGELFQAGFAWAKQLGLNKMTGPKGFTALDGLGLLVKGFELRPALGQPYNPPYYPALIEAQGFERTGEIVSGILGAEIKFPDRIHQLAERIRERRGLHIARFHSRNELRKAIRHLETLYNEVLEGTGGGTPISDEEMKTLANQILWFADPELIKIVMKDDRPVGFLLAYPDISAGLQKTKGRLWPFGWAILLREIHKTDWININGAGMIEEYRGLGGTAILYSEMFKSVLENPRYQHAEVVQIGMENDKMQREMENFGVNFCKIHCMYMKNLLP